MLKNRPPTQSTLEFVCIDELVPKDHLLRKIEAKIDFSFIHELVKDLYCDNNGRPALDPTLMFKLYLLATSTVFAKRVFDFVKQNGTSKSPFCTQSSTA